MDLMANQSGQPADKRAFYIVARARDDHPSVLRAAFLVLPGSTPTGSFFAA